MRVLISNNTGIVAGYLAGKYPKNIGHLYSPGAQIGPWEWMPYALDNGAFSAFTKKEKFNFEAWHKLLNWAKTSGTKPQWVLVPDKVGDRDRTLKMWKENYKKALILKSPLAFAAQDGMSFSDVPKEADVVFIGGTTEWKQKNIFKWCKKFPRVHVGRINTYKGLLHCEKAGAESVDGTGYFRSGKRTIAELTCWLAETTGEKKRNEMFLWEDFYQEAKP